MGFRPTRSESLPYSGDRLSCGVKFAENAAFMGMELSSAYLADASRYALQYGCSQQGVSPGSWEEENGKGEREQGEGDSRPDPAIILSPAQLLNYRR